MIRRRLLLALSALWLVGAFAAVALMSGIYGPVAPAIRVLIAVGLMGLGAFVATGWVVETDRRNWALQRTGQTVDSDEWWAFGVSDHAKACALCGGRPS